MAMMTLRTLVVMSRELWDAVDGARAEIAARTSEPVSRSAMIRMLLWEALNARKRAGE